MITHAMCGRSWSGLTRSHCGSCHETFTGEHAADKHRVGAFGVDRRCLPPAEVGLIAREKPWGILWGMPLGDLPAHWRRGADLEEGTDDDA